MYLTDEFLILKIVYKRDGGRPTKISMLFSKGFDDAP